MAISVLEKLAELFVVVLFEWPAALLEWWGRGGGYRLG
jgi:hypothetical protein